MKFVVAVVILCTVHSSYSQVMLCEEQNFRRRIEDCFMNNDMGMLLGGSGIMEMSRICSADQLPKFSACMANVTKECVPDFYDWSRMVDATNRICKSLDSCPSSEGMIGTCVQNCNMNSDCTNGKLCCSNGCGHDCMEPQYTSDDCGINHNGLSMCISSMKKSWEENKWKSALEEDKMWCNLYGGMKNCISKYMMDSCKNKWKYTDLINTFGPEKCTDYHECRICPMVSFSTVPTSSITITLASVATVSFLLRRL